MGWGSATPLYDNAVEVALMFAPKIPEHASENEWNTPEVIVRAVVEEMYTKNYWDDWDTQDESKFYDKYLIHVMHERGEIEDNEYEYVLAGRPDDWDWENKSF